MLVVPDDVRLKKICNYIYDNEMMKHENVIKKYGRSLQFLQNEQLINLNCFILKITSNSSKQIFVYTCIELKNTNNYYFDTNIYNILYAF